MAALIFTQYPYGRKDVLNFCTTTPKGVKLSRYSRFGTNTRRKLEQLTDLAETLTQYIHAVRAGEKLLPPKPPLTEIAQKLALFSRLLYDEHERAL